MYIHVHDYIHVYIHGTYTFIIVYICIYIVQARLYCFKTTLHFSSGPISLATPASLSCPQATSTRAAEQPPSSHQSPHMTDHPGEACHVQTATATGLPQYTLLPRLPSAAAVSQLPAGKPEPWCWLYLWGMVGVKLPSRNKGFSGTLPTMPDAGPT
jgi:hypothetical protein